MVNVNNIINIIEGVCVSGITAFGAYILKQIGDRAVSYISKKEIELETKKGEKSFEEYLPLARTVAKSVLQDIAESKDMQGLIKNKETLFHDRLKKYLPALNEDEINVLVQAVKQEFGQADTLLNADTIQQQVEVVKTENTNLKLQNLELKKKIEGLNALLNPVQGECINV